MPGLAFHPEQLLQPARGYREVAPFDSGTREGHQLRRPLELSIRGERDRARQAGYQCDDFVKLLAISVLDEQGELLDTFILAGSGRNHGWRCSQCCLSQSH